MMTCRHPGVAIKWFWIQNVKSAMSSCAYRGGAPIGAGGHDPHFSRQRGTGGPNLGIIHRKYQHQCQSATNQTKELGWLSYLSNILSPHWPKSGGSKFFSHFQNRGAALVCLVNFSFVFPCGNSEMFEAKLIGFSTHDGRWCGCEFPFERWKSGENGRTGAGFAIWVHGVTCCMGRLLWQL